MCGIDTKTAFEKIQHVGKELMISISIPVTITVSLWSNKNTSCNL